MSPMLAGLTVITMCLLFGVIDPVMIRTGPLEVRWYGVMYVLGALMAIIVGRSELRRKGGPVPEEMWAEMLFYALVGLVLGGRLGYVLVYDPLFFLEHPTEIPATWHGGLSFHGGLVGVVIAGLILAHKRKLPFFELADIAAMTGPIWIMLVKIGNFINGELYGRVTAVPWSMIFPLGGNVARHPSQLYEAFFEGPLLFIILWRFRLATKVPGHLFALFLVSYGCLRFAVEFFREPDPQLGFLFGWMTMGQILCLIMVLSGLLLFWMAPSRLPSAISINSHRA